MSLLFLVVTGKTSLDVAECTLEEIGTKFPVVQNQFFGLIQVLEDEDTFIFLFDIHIFKFYL